MLLKNRSKKKLNNFVEKLNKYNISEKEQKKLIKLFKNVNNITNILIISVTLSLLVFSFGLTMAYLQKKYAGFNDISVKIFEENVFLTFTSISGLLVLFNRFLTLFLFVRVLTSRSEYIGFGIKLLTFLSIIPFLSVIFLFIVKFKIKHIYKKNR